MSDKDRASVGTEAKAASEPAAKAVVSPESISHAFEGSAVFSNRVLVTSTPLGMRLSFMETSPQGTDKFRTAVFLQITDAMKLRDLLQDQMKNYQIEMKTQPKKAD